MDLTLENCLDFERPIAELEEKIRELKNVVVGSEQFDLNAEITALQKKSLQYTRNIYTSLNAWQISQVARHPARPYLLDYIEHIVTDFEELHGDRLYGDDSAMVCGIGRLDTQAVAIIGQQKGRDVKERVYRNYGMPKPEGYRKAARIMQLAERHHLPILSFIDTPGAFPGIDAEERGQSEAIASNLSLMSGLTTPMIATVIGEGGSGGALAIGMGDRLYMLEYSTYSVISPEGCASILWKDATKANEAAEAMGITAKYLLEQELIDAVIEEPVGGAHRDSLQTMTAVKAKLLTGLDELHAIDPADRLTERQRKFRSIGVFKEK